MNQKFLDYCSEIIMTYGHDNVKDELQGFIDTHRHDVKLQMLTALGSTIRDNVVEAMAESDMDAMSSSHSTHHNNMMRRKKNSKMDKIQNSTNTMSCPIYKALTIGLGIPASQLVTTTAEEILQKQRELVSHWGRPLPPPFLIQWMFEAEVQQMAQWKMNFQRNHPTHDRNHANSSHHQNYDQHPTALMTVSNSVIKHGNMTSDSQIEWSQMKKITISDLKLFEVCKGCVLEGTLVADAFTPMVGTSTLVEDGRGSIIKIAVYNMLPSGVAHEDADALGKKMLPRGSQVKIAEPFLKIFRDGSRGIRIDDPGDIQVIKKGGKSQQEKGAETGEDRHREEEMLLRGKQEGNAFFEKKLYFAASESYIEALRNNHHLIPTLLSNRSQACIQLGYWAEAMCDAAASLTLRPNCKKTWNRYWKAASELGIPEANTRSLCSDREKLRNALLCIFSTSNNCSSLAQVGEEKSPPEDLIKETIMERSPEALKADGNDAFKAGNFHQARSLYSMAITSAGRTTQAILSNWSQCALYLNSWHDAIAASAASLRIFPEKKSVYRLAKSLIMIGEPEVSVAVLENFNDMVSNNAAHRELVSCAKMLSTKNNLSVYDSIHNSSQLFPSNWVGPIETFLTREKGRGVRAVDDIHVGQIVLLELPIISYKLEAKRGVIAQGVGVDSMNDGSNVFLKTAVINRLQRDGAFASIINRLYDGISVPPLSSFDHLFLSLSSAHLLLPSHHEYLPGKRINISRDRVSAIIDKNSHGLIMGQETDTGMDLKGENTLGFSELFPATSMFNHSKTPNCVYAKFGNGRYQEVIANKEISKGEELTVCYHEDEEVFKRHWLQS